MTKQTGFKVPVTVLLLALVAACATNPVTGKREISLMSEAEEIAIGQQADAEVRREMRPYDDPELQRYVSDLGMKLASVSHRPHLPWSFAVVDHPAVNAFALPGGYIYVTRGLLAYMNDESELVGVLGHEIGHVTARHAAQQYTRAVGGGIGLAVLGIFVPATRPFGDVASVGLNVAFLKYGRDDERESDRLGIEYSAKSGWDPAGVPRFLGTLARIDELSERGVPNWLSTHPDPGARVAETEPIAAQLTSGDTARRNRDDFLRRIDGIVFGDNPEDGIVRGNVFLHPVMRFGLEFPEGWEVMNSPTQVAAREPGLEHYMLLQLVDQPRGRNAEEIALGAMQRASFRRVDGQATTINGLDAYVGLYQGSLGDLGAVIMRAAHIVHGRQVFVFAGFAPQKQYEQIDRVVSGSLRTFRELSRTEADNVKPNRLDFYTVRTGDTWQSIASRNGSVVRPVDLAIMNNSAVNEQPKPGTQIKIVVQG